MKECQNLQEFLQAFFPENAELEGFRKRLAADATPDREGLTEALREPDAGEQIRLFEGGDAAGLAAARSRAYSAAFYDACFPEADSAGQALSRERRADAPARYHGKSARCPVFCLRSGA